MASTNTARTQASGKSNSGGRASGTRRTTVSARETNMYGQANSPAKLRISEEFVYGLADIYSDHALDQIRNSLNMLTTVPKMGTTYVRPSLAKRYGGTIRVLAVLTLSIVYRYDEESNTLDILALVYGSLQ